MNAPSPTPTLRARLGVGLAVACFALLLAGCGSELSRAEEATTTSTEVTRTTEATGPTSTSESPGTSIAGGTTDGAPSGVPLPTGVTLPDGTEITLPDGVDLTIPSGLGDCVEAGAALTELSLGALGVSSPDAIDRHADTLYEAFGPGSSNDIELVVQVAREASEDGQINPGAAADEAYTTALENLTDRLAEVCGVG